MRTDGEWTYYTPQEAADILVEKQEGDEFFMDGYWDGFGGDIHHDRNKMYAIELDGGGLNQDEECIRRPRDKAPEENHFI